MAASKKHRTASGSVRQMKSAKNCIVYKAQKKKLIDEINAVAKNSFGDAIYAIVMEAAEESLSDMQDEVRDNIDGRFDAFKDDIAAEMRTTFAGTMLKDKVAAVLDELSMPKAWHDQISKEIVLATCIGLGQIAPQPNMYEWLSSEVRNLTEASDAMKAPQPKKGKAKKQA